MALINNQTFGLTKWWLSCALNTLPKDRDIFRTAKMRDARIKFIAGSNVLKAIREWLLAAQVIQKSQESGCYELTNTGRAIAQHDIALEKASTWWILHLSICLPSRHHEVNIKDEPYSSLFCNLDSISKNWISREELERRVLDVLANEYAQGSVIPSWNGVMNMFAADEPLAEIGLLEIDSTFNRIRLGRPLVSDETIVYGLAKAKVSIFPTRTTIDFMELIKNNVNAFLCLTPDDFRQRLRNISNSSQWKDYFSFSETANLNSLFFSDNINPESTMIMLLKSGKDSWS